MLTLIFIVVVLPLISQKFYSTITQITGMAVSGDTTLPPTYHQFYGTVKYSDGGNLADGTSITAKVNNIESSIVTLSGKYGYSPLFLVENANDGNVIEFYVSGTKGSEYTFEDGATTQLNLVVPISSGGSSGSSSGGGGGGAGYVPSCSEKWECDEWSICSADEIQRRACKDENKCGTIGNKPAELRKCIYEASEGVPEEKEIKEKTKIVEAEKEEKIPAYDKEKFIVNKLIVTTTIIFVILIIGTYKLMQSKNQKGLKRNIGK